jgi:esterase/lipase superfamily enzyme
VALTALRELLIEVRASGRNPLEELRIHNVVLAAPDLDLSVTMQRVAAERLGAGVGRITLYTSQHDKALSLSELLFGGLFRVGQLDLLNVSDDLKKSTTSAGSNAAVIEYIGKRSSSFGHSYFRESPAVASDLILTLRYDRDPGAENGRPLKRVGPIFWQIDDDYLASPGS